MKNIQSEVTILSISKSFFKEPFDAEEFVERLAWRTIAETKTEGDEGDINPSLLHDSFVQAIK